MKKQVRIDERFSGLNNTTICKHKMNGKGKSSCPALTSQRRWEFIKESKRAKKQAFDQESDQEKRKKTRSRPRKQQRKQE